MVQTLDVSIFVRLKQWLHVKYKISFKTFLAFV